MEVISPSNTDREMERKLREYFAAGAELVWYIYPESQSAIVYTGPDQFTEIDVDGVLSGGEVLPGFELSLQKLFAEDAGADQPLPPLRPFSAAKCFPRYIRRKNLKSQAVSGRIYSSDGLFY